MGRVRLTAPPPRRAHVPLGAVMAQLGRRNLHPDQFALLVGRRYNRAKKAVGGDRKSETAISSPQSEGLKTAEKIAREHGLGRATVERAGQFADAIERVKAIAPSIECEVATGTAGMLIAVSRTVRCAAITPPGMCGLRGVRRRAL